MKLLLTTFLLVSMVLCSSFVELTMAAPPPTGPPVTNPTYSYCDSKCEGRCAAAGYKRRCLKYCSICCQACKCVPSGPSANKSECPCYRDKKNSKGKSKCP